MAPTAPQLAFRQSGLKVVAYSSSPTDKQYKGPQGHYMQSRAGQYAAAGLTASWYNSKKPSTDCRTVAALPEPLSATAAAITPETAVDTSVDPVTVRLMTAATILSRSDSDSDTETAETFSSIDEDTRTLTTPLGFLDDLTTLDANSLSLAIGILRQQQPVDVYEADVQLSERLRDFLILLHRRPASKASSRFVSRSSSPAFGSSPSSSRISSAFNTLEEDGFWAGKDEWTEVRCALMSIGIDASLDEDDDEDVWTLEEEGPARRTRLLKSLPRLTADTAQQLAAFLASLQQDNAAAIAVSNSHDSSAEDEHGPTAAAADERWSEEDAKWWEEVTEAYHLLWQQAKVQQAK